MLLLMSNGFCMSSSHSTFKHCFTSFIICIDACPFFS